jgi:hypothetical protein
MYIKFIKNILKANKINVEFIYKKHPSERWFSPIKDFATTQSEIDINLVDIFVGFNTTMLINVSSMHKCAIQLISNRIKQDNYQNFGFCLTYKLSDINKKGLNVLSGREFRIPCLSPNNLSKIIEEIALK